MSKSDPNSAIFMEDSEAEVNTKIKKAYCPPQVGAAFWVTPPRAAPRAPPPPRARAPRRAAVQIRRARACACPCSRAQRSNPLAHPPPPAPARRPQVVEGNPCIEYVCYIVFPWFGHFKVRRGPWRWGGGRGGGTQEVPPQQPGRAQPLAPLAPDCAPLID
jgi:hypothetical protein